MTTKRNYRDETITFECDGCGDEYEASTDDWGPALAEFKRNGGVARKECDDSWVHLCAECQ